MREANPKAHLTRLITDKNYLGAQLFLKQAELEEDERNELMGMLAASVVDELSRVRRDDRERIVYLRSVLAWILREIPGLGSLYREQLRGSVGGADLISEMARGLRNFGDVASGRKSVGDGLNEAADDARRNFEDTAERFRSGESGDRVNEFIAGAEKGIRQGLDQLGEFFRVMNEGRESGGGYSSSASGTSHTAEDGRAAARADSDGDVEDAEVSSEGSEEGESTQDIHVERE